MRCLFPLGMILPLTIPVPSTAKVIDPLWSSFWDVFLNPNSVFDLQCKRRWFVRSKGQMINRVFYGGYRTILWFSWFYFIFKKIRDSHVWLLFSLTECSSDCVCGVSLLLRGFSSLLNRSAGFFSMGTGMSILLRILFNCYHEMMKFHCFTSISC